MFQNIKAENREEEVVKEIAFLIFVTNKQEFPLGGPTKS